MGTNTSRQNNLWVKKIKYLQEKGRTQQIISIRTQKSGIVKSTTAQVLVMWLGLESLAKQAKMEKEKQTLN